MIKENNMVRLNEFQELVREIHRVNKGWHCFKTSNSFLGRSNIYLQSYYLKQKNYLQKQLEDDFSDMMEIIPPDDTGNPSIIIKEQYVFDGYRDACHKIKEKVNIND